MTAGFNLAQSRALAIVPKITGSLGFLFSWLIVVTVARDSSKRNKTYHRLLVGISLTDISSSFWLGLSTWPIPDNSTVLWAIGNDQTCNVQGFFTQFGISSSFYNASLSLYFLLVIRYGWKEARIRKIEPFLHAVPMLWGFGTAFAGLGLGIFGNATLWCWIAPKHVVYRWALFYGPLWTMIFLVTTSSIIIYHHVRRLELRTNKYKYAVGARPQAHNNWSSSASSFNFARRNDTSATMTFPSVTLKTTSTPAEVRGQLAGATDEQLEVGVKSERGDRVASKNEPPGQDEAKTEECSAADEVSSAVHDKATPQSNSSIGVGLNRQTIQADASDGLNPPPPRRSMLGSISSRFNNSRANRENAAAHRKRTKEVASQCFWFAGAFYINWIALSLTRLLQTINGEIYYPLILIAAITTPLQGLPNVIVYLGPKFRKLRYEWPAASVWQVLKASLARERPGVPATLDCDV